MGHRAAGEAMVAGDDVAVAAVGAAVPRIPPAARNRLAVRSEASVRPAIAHPSRKATVQPLRPAAALGREVAPRSHLAVGINDPVSSAGMIGAHGPSVVLVPSGGSAPSEGRVPSGGLVPRRSHPALRPPPQRRVRRSHTRATPMAVCWPRRRRSSTPAGAFPKA